MSRFALFGLFYLAVFLQAGAYGLTFLLPRLFAGFGGTEKTVGQMLFVTATITMVTVYYAGHLSDIFGRLRTLAIACLAIAAALAMYAGADEVGVVLVLASGLLGFGWGLTYSLAPIVLTRLVRPDERVRGFAMLSVFVMAGFGFAPVAASMFESAGFGIPFAFRLTAILCVLSAVVFAGLHGPVRSHALNAGSEAPSRITYDTVLEVARSRALVPIIMVFLGASVFAGVSNFQSVYADARGLDYSDFFLIYTVVVIVFRLGLARFTGGPNPYLTIGLLQCLMCGSVVLFLFSGTSEGLYFVVAVLFGLGYGVSYPILVAMASEDALDHLVPQTLQLFALTYFAGVFGFPLVAGWMIVTVGSAPVLLLVAFIAAVEVTMAMRRAIAKRQA